MRKIILGLFVCLLAQTSIGQLKEIKDTIWINNVKLIPGDTLHLGGGSAPDGSYVYIFADIQKIKMKYLKKDVKYLIYVGRKDFGKKIMKLFMPVFMAPNDKTDYTISFPQAIQTNEITF